MARKAILLAVLAAALVGAVGAQTLNLPPRPATAYGAEDLARLMSLLPQPPDPRFDAFIWTQIITGNVPSWERKLVLIATNASIQGTNHTVKYYVTPDYFCLGADNDYLLEPMTPALAQRVANYLHCSLPTRKMVRQIWSQTKVKIVPINIPPSDLMTTAPVFYQHSQIVWQQRSALLAAHPLGELVAGDKKDVVISALLVTNFHRSRTPVVIYGWQMTNGVAIQPLYNGHANTWVDYSHGVRLVQKAMWVDGKPTTVSAVLTNPAYAALLSDETNFPGNVVPRPYYVVPPEAIGGQR